MAQYKVPQDVEADDKLLGPFNFRQLCYLLLSGGCIGLAVLFFTIFPALALIPIPPLILLLALSLPLKKDQPMEAYLAALVSFYTKPRKRTWETGQKESTIVITAPKINPEENRIRNISGEEATNRLSFLANIVDTQGAAINGIASSPMRDDLAAEAQTATDIFEKDTYTIDQAIKANKEAHHNEIMERIRKATQKQEPSQEQTAPQKTTIEPIVTAAPLTQPVRSNTVYQAIYDQPQDTIGETPKAPVLSEEQKAAIEAERAAIEAEKAERARIAEHQANVEKMRNAIMQNETPFSSTEEKPKINRRFFDEIKKKTESIIKKPEIIMPSNQNQGNVPQKTAKEEKEAAMQFKIPGQPEQKQETVASTSSFPQHTYTGTVPTMPKPVENPVEKTAAPTPPKQDIIDLANNSDFSVATIAEQANRIKRKDDEEVFISLH